MALMKISDIKANPNNPRIHQCLNCKKEFYSIKWCATREPKYCSKECYWKSLVINKHKICTVCWKEITRQSKRCRKCATINQWNRIKNNPEISD